MGEGGGEKLDEDGEMMMMRRRKRRRRKYMSVYCTSTSTLVYNIKKQQPHRQ
jgi:hypothetical protein